jgi:rubrerythrin
MTTLVGLQENFADALISLLELDYDAIEAYNMAIARLESAEFESQLLKFKADHERHVKELGQLLATRKLPIPTGPDAKQWLTKGKVALANILGDKALLMAMRSNEVDTNVAYERVCDHSEIWPDAVEIVERGWEDEKRHKAWFEQII